MDHSKVIDDTEPEEGNLLVADGECHVGYSADLSAGYESERYDYKSFKDINAIQSNRRSDSTSTDVVDDPETSVSTGSAVARDTGGEAESHASVILDDQQPFTVITNNTNNLQHTEETVKPPRVLRLQDNFETQSKDDEDTFEEAFSNCMYAGSYKLRYSEDELASTSEKRTPINYATATATLVVNNTDSDTDDQGSQSFTRLDSVNTLQEQINDIRDSKWIETQTGDRSVSLSTSAFETIDLDDLTLREDFGENFSTVTSTLILR